MKTIQIAVAVTLALALVGSFFVFPGISFFSSSESNTATDTTTNSSLAMENNEQLQITDTEVGTGAVAEAGDSVTVDYVGSLTNGTVFDASANHGSAGFTFTLGAGQVIQGWDQGIQGMKEGGKRRLVIPPALAYGDQAVGGVIPANSTLTFEVELRKVEKK